MPEKTTDIEIVPMEGIQNSAFMIKDEAIFKNISNESVSLSYNLQRTSKSAIQILKKLENLLIDDNFISKYTEIVQILDQVGKQDLFNYKNEENNESLLHQLINRPKSFVNEQALIQFFMKFVEKGCNINAVDSYNWSCLHYCCVYNKAELAQSIINHELFNKSLINDKSCKQFKTETLYYLIGTTPLQICAWINNLTFAKKLVKFGANINDKNEAGWTCLHICARQAHFDFIIYLLEKGANVNEGNNHDKTPLHVSSRHGHANIAELLLKSKANVSLINNYGQSALYVAVSRSQINIIKLLLEYGSDVNQTDKQQNTTLHACALLRETTKTGSSNTIDLDYDKSMLNVKIGEILLKEGCNPTKQNYLGCTPLHYAAKNNCVNFAAMLLTHAPISINIRDIYGQTALYTACKWKSENVSRLLLNKSANKDICDLTGKTPLHLCAEEGTDNVSLMTQLFNFGEDVNKASIGKDNDTPLHIASRNNHSHVISYLLENHADVNKANKNGETPLHISSQHGSYESCLILLDGGAKINKITKAGLTPLHSSIMAQKHSVRVASLLIDFGVSINQEDNEKITPLAMSTIRGNFGVANLLIEKKAKIINSNYESVAHTCAKENQCDSACFKLLVSTYGFESLFDYSLTNYRTPFQLCVEKKSQVFLKAAISCDNIQCFEWFKSLHSTRGFGVSPMVMVRFLRKFHEPSII
jgi:ankyrin repeat protein